MQIYNRQQQAWLWSAERLFAENEKIYFWGLTFVNTPIDDEMAMEDFNQLMTRVKNIFHGIQGLRVCELHRSHGIHFHLLINQRIPIRRMKRIARGNMRLNGVNRYLDFGRMSATICDFGAAEYLSKYLVKGYCERNSFWHRRRWGTIGGFKQVRCKDIEFETLENINQRKMFGGYQIKMQTMRMIWYYTKLWGEVEEWPRPHKALVYRQEPGNWLDKLDPF